MRNLRFDVQRDLARRLLTPHVLVRASLAVTTLAELIALPRRSRDEAHYASSGAGGAIHLGASCSSEAGIDVVTLSGRRSTVMGALDVDILSMTPAPRSRTSAPASSRRWRWRGRSARRWCPNVPTFAELGLPAVISSSWFGFAAPADTPADVIGRLAAAMPQVFASRDYQSRLATLGLEQFTLGAEQSAAFIKAELDKWAEVARSARIQID
jgi:tripartite-type tricarboxylate transporter receptor subunit TctC